MADSNQNQHQNQNQNQNQKRHEQQQRERVTYMTLVGLFLGLLGVVASRERGRKGLFSLGPHELVVLGLATYRGARIVSYDRVTEPLRAPVTETVPDEFDAGENVVAEGAGVRKAIGELVSCPTCVGTWIAAGLVYGMHLEPRLTRLVAAILGVSGLAEIFSASAEALTWSAQAARKRSGS